MKFLQLKSLFFLAIFFITAWIFLNKKISAESPYIYSCILTSVTPSPQISSFISPTPTPINTPTLTRTPTPVNNPTLTGTPTPTKTLTPIITLTPTRTPTPIILSECRLIMGTGQKTKADLVILAEDYPTEAEFLIAANKAAVAMNKTNLGQARLAKINLWALMDLTQTYFQGFNCPTANGVTVACWDHMKAFNTAISRCGGDSYLVFNNDTHRTGSIGGISVWGGTYIYNYALDQPTVPHELGHSLTGLVDEYSFGIAAPVGSVTGLNCSDTGSASETTPCPKWVSKFPNVGCYLRCGFTNFYRPAFRSIMDKGGSGAVYDFNEPSLVDGWDEMLKLFQ